MKLLEKSAANIEKMLSVEKKKKTFYVQRDFLSRGHIP